MSKISTKNILKKIFKGKTDKKVKKKVSKKKVVKAKKTVKTKKAKKIISAPSFRLEGSGWYETDFKTGNKKNLVQSEDKSKKTNKEIKKADNSKTSKKD